MCTPCPAWHTRFRSRHLSLAAHIGPTLEALPARLWLAWGEHDVTATRPALDGHRWRPRTRTAQRPYHRRRRPLGPVRAADIVNAAAGLAVFLSPTLHTTFHEPPLHPPIALGPLTLPNRIVIAPMCQYSAVDGQATDWHLIHLGQLALSGAGLLILEATAVERRSAASPPATWACTTTPPRPPWPGCWRPCAGIPHAPGHPAGHAGRKVPAVRPGTAAQQVPPDGPGRMAGRGAVRLPHIGGELPPRRAG
jgi:hypothetical protein